MFTFRGLNFQQIRTKTVLKNAARPLIQNSPVLGPITESQIQLNLNEPLPFNVARMKSGLLPVYRKMKNGKTRTVTVIRKVEGDRSEFAKMLATVIPAERIDLKLGATVAIDGDYVELVREWLTRHKF